MAEGVMTQDEFFELVGYLKNLSSRMQSLMGLIDTLERQGTSFDFVFESRKKQMTSELSDLKKGFLEVQDQIRFMQKNTLLAIGELKSTVKKEDVQRLEKKTDSWSPECMVCRGEAKKVVSKNF
jgi:hypothetical protein